jgi:transposase
VTSWRARWLASALLKVPRARFTAVPGYPGIQAHQGAKTVHGHPQRILLTHSETLHQAQSRGFDQTLGKVTAWLEELADTLARGKSRRTRQGLEDHLQKITHNSWVAEVLTTSLAGDTPATFRLTFAVDAAARRKLENRVFGKRILITNQPDWSPAEIVAAYRSQSHVEDSFRQLKDRHVVSFSPMHHWTDDHIRVHAFTCVLALQIAHPMTRTAANAGYKLSTRALLDELGTIEETVLLHHDGAKGRPRAQRMLTEHSKRAAKLGELFNLKTYAPTR